MDFKGGEALSSLYKRRGVLRGFDRDMDGALEDYGKAIDSDPKNAAAYAERGRMHAQRKELDLALQDLDRSIEIDPQPFPLVSRALVYDIKGERARAIADVNTAASLDRSPDLRKQIDRLLSAWGSGGAPQNTAPSNDKKSGSDPH
jgi:tetratricopeptide (TPR) repeat protein